VRGKHGWVNNADLGGASLLEVYFIDVGQGDGILIRTPSLRDVAEEAPGAYKDVNAVVDAADEAKLARKVARLEPLVCVKG